MGYGYTVLAAVPQLALFPLLWFLMVGILHAGRRMLEGVPYNFSLGSEIGDFMLVTIVVMGVGILQRDAQPEWADDPVFHSVAFGVAAIAGIVAVYFAPGARVMDYYHHMVILPFFFYFVLIVGIPVILAVGTWGEKIGLLFCAAVWVVCISDDALSGRLQQIEWIKSNIHRL